MEESVQVDATHRGKLVEGVLDERLRNEDTGVVDERIKASEVFDGRIEDPLGGFRGCDIASDRRNLRIMGEIARIDRTRIGDDGISDFPVSLHEAGAYALRCSRDDSDLVFRTHEIGLQMRAAAWRRQCMYAPLEEMKLNRTKCQAPRTSGQWLRASDACRL